MKDVKFEDWRLTVFWVAVAAATAIAGFVFGWSWRDRTGALANVSLLAAMTAIGTVGATVAAVAIASWQYRTQRMERYAEAVLVIGEAYPRLAGFHAVLIECSNTFDGVEKFDLSAKDIRAVISDIQDAYRMADLPAPKQLLPLRESLAHEMALVISQLHPMVSFAVDEALETRAGRLEVVQFMQQGIKVAMPLIESLSESGYQLLKREVSSTA